MPKYVYPAVFTPEDGGMFSVNFPDIENCFTCGGEPPRAKSRLVFLSRLFTAYLGGFTNSGSA